MEWLLIGMLIVVIGFIAVLTVQVKSRQPVWALSTAIIGLPGVAYAVLYPMKSKVALICFLFGFASFGYGYISFSEADMNVLTEDVAERIRITYDTNPEARPLIDELLAYYPDLKSQLFETPDTEESDTEE